MKTHDELVSMTTKQLKEYAKEIGCCLGYDAARKETTIRAIEAQQRCLLPHRGRLAADCGRCLMSQLYEGWDVDSMLRCLKERMDNIRALCDVVLEADGVGDEARTLAKNVLYELDGCDAK